MAAWNLTSAADAVARFPDAAERLLIVYGGSLKPDNALDILSQPDVDGGLVGGASLQADSFLAIVSAARTAKT